MLIDYIAELKAALAERRLLEVNGLIAINGNHEFTRGQIHGLDRALSIIDEVLGRYTNPEDDLPEAVVGTHVTPRFRPISSATKARGRA